VNPGDYPFVAYPVPGEVTFKQVSVDKSDRHVCGLSTDSLAYCWGDNQSGELGDGTFINRTTPTPVSGGRRFLSITAGAGFTCARNLNNHPYCWGANTYAQLGTGLYTGDVMTPVRVRTPKLFSVLNAGLEYVCGVTTDSHAYCWGRDTENQLGDGAPPHRSDSLPMPVAGTRLYKQVDGGIDHSCALSTSDLAFCWGYGWGIGDGRFGSQPAPVRVAGGLKFAQLSTGWYHTCAVTFNQEAFCWGGSITGQINGSQPISSLVPVAVMTDYRFTQISTGAELTCGITPASRVVCWGLGGQDGRPHQIHALM
jgi:alpha-tubulin suppressor-like RCC1 family protein